MHAIAANPIKVGGLAIRQNSVTRGILLIALFATRSNEAWKPPGVVFGRCYMHSKQSQQHLLHILIMD